MKFENAPQPDVFTQVSAVLFIQQKNLLQNDLSAFLTPYNEIDYNTKETRLFLSLDKKSCFGINLDGELISVFALKRSQGKILVTEAMRQGAVYLSCMGDHLLQLYSEFCFLPIKIIKWDNQFAPQNWNYKRFGTPNIYDMKLGSGNSEDKI